MLASLKVEQQKPDEALQHLRESMQKWFPSLQRMLQDSDSDRDEEEEEREMLDGTQDLDAQLPSFEFRFETAKLLIELDETTEKAVLVRARPRATSSGSRPLNYTKTLLGFDGLHKQLESSHIKSIRPDL